MRVDATRAGEKERHNAAALAVRRAAPFPDPDFGVTWDSKGNGAAWYWSRSRVADLLAARQHRARRIDFVPEPLLVGRAPAGAGPHAELIQLHEGVEGRIWQDGLLVADRWWPQMPSPEEWAAFQRTAGLSPGEVETATPEGAVALRPWTSGSRRASGADLSSLDNYLPRIVAAACLGVLLVGAFLAGTIVRSAIDIQAARKAALDLDAPLKKILDARERADREQATIRQLLSLRAPRGSLELLAETSRLAPSGSRVAHWSLANRDRLELTLAGPDLDPQKVVASWEDSELLSDVSTELLAGRDQLVVRSTVSARAAEVAAEDPAP